MIFADDQRFDTIGALGNPDIKTPNLDKLIEYRIDGVRHTQLFNLREDPRELNNLADDPAHAAILTQLRERLAVGTVKN